MAQTIILRGPYQRQEAHSLIDRAPENAVVRVAEATRNNEQNARFWAMLSDISRAKPEGRQHTPEVWKALFMHALGYETRFEMGLSGEPFPIGFRSSRLTVRQMADLITFISEYGDRHGVQWTEPHPDERTGA
jgi:hypothetical protein